MSNPIVPPDDINPLKPAYDDGIQRPHQPKDKRSIPSLDQEDKYHRIQVDAALQLMSDGTRLREGLYALNTRFIQFGFWLVENHPEDYIVAPTFKPVSINADKQRKFPTLAQALDYCIDLIIEQFELQLVNQAEKAQIDNAALAYDLNSKFINEQYKFSLDYQSLKTDCEHLQEENDKLRHQQDQANEK